MKKAIIVIICLACILCGNTANAKDDFPWLMTPYKYASLTDNQRVIYANGFLETLFFIMYSYSPDAGEAVKQNNSFVDCAMQTKDSSVWNPLKWTFSEELDKSAAYVLYHYNSPTVCRNYNSNSTKPKILRIYSYADWQRWSLKDKAVYLSAYLDTAAVIEMVKKQEGYDNALRDLSILIQSTGIEGILSEVVNVKFEKNNPLPWSIALGVGASIKK